MMLTWEDVKHRRDTAGPKAQEWSIGIFGGGGMKEVNKKMNNWLSLKKNWNIVKRCFVDFCSSRKRTTNHIY